MKKRIFEIWYDEYGKELATSSYPIDDDILSEKDIRIRAKSIFSDLYDLIKYENDINLSFIQNKVKEFISENKNITLRLSENKKILENEKSEIVAILTNLYDEYFKNHSIDKTYFDKMRRFYGEKLSNYKHSIKEIEQLISCNKSEKKSVESLLIDYYCD